MSNDAPVLTPAEIRVLKALVAFVRGAGAGGGAGVPAPAGSNEANDADLDGRYGNPVVRKNPKRWAGDSYEGANYSDCPSDFLLCLAEYLEWMAEQDAKKPEPPKHRNGTAYYEYNRKDARLARGWARRNQGMRTAPPDGRGSSNGTSVDDPYAPRGDEVGALPENEIPF